MTTNAPSRQTISKSTNNLSFSHQQNLKRLPSLVVAPDHLAVPPSRFNVDSNKNIQSSTGLVNLPRQNFDGIAPPIRVRITIPSKNDFVETQSFKTPLAAQGVRLSSFIYLTPSMQMEGPAEGTKHSKVSFSVLQKPSRSVVELSLKDTIELERQKARGSL
jgi:hypothetical protein